MLYGLVKGNIVANVFITKEAVRNKYKEFLMLWNYVKIGDENMEDHDQLEMIRLCGKDYKKQI